MKLLFFTEARLTQSAEGKFYSDDQSFSYQMFARYLNVFDSVLVVARSTAIAKNTIDERTRVDKNRIKVLSLPYYIGPYQYLKERNNVVKTLRNYLDSNPDAAIICRVPGTIGTAAAKYCMRKSRHYGVEVVGDPCDVFAAGSFNHPLRILLKHSGMKSLKAIVKDATAAMYVTKTTLQQRYPIGNNLFSTYASNVMLPPDAFVQSAKTLKKTKRFTLVAVGALSAMYKSPDIVIDAMTILKNKRLDVGFKWLGDGRYRTDMVDLARQRGVSDMISFVGNVGSAVEVRHYLDIADLFVLPSRTEGLPRALVEAMARGLPCIGTDIGGIPELLEEQALIPINNAKRLADKIEDFLLTPGLADTQAKRNLKESQNYACQILETRRMEFYQYLKEIS